jgi:hypothetical protein
MNSKPLQKLGLLALAVICGLGFGTTGTCVAQESTFDWTTTNEETARLDPADYHTGRVFRPGDHAGNVHIDIEAQEPLTVEMASTEQWSETLRHPELLPRVTFHCIREHVTKLTYVCNVAPGRPMTLVLRDERNPDRTSVTGFGADLADRGTEREFLSPNDIHIQYYRWSCVENCNPPRYQWVGEVKEIYDLSSGLKTYDGISADRDGQPFSVKINSPVPMIVAILPSRVADELRGKPENLDSVLGKRLCVQRSARSAAFECIFDLADGPQSLIAVPEPSSKIPLDKKAEVEVMASKCVANCLTDPKK